MKAFFISYFCIMFKTGHFYHFLTAVVFICMGLYFWFLNPESLSLKGINPMWFGGVLLIWGVFRGINGFLMLRKKRNNQHDQ